MVGDDASDVEMARQGEKRRLDATVASAQQLGEDSTPEDSTPRGGDAASSAAHARSLRAVASSA